MSKQTKLVHIPVEKLYPHENNPRKDLGDLTELAESIKANGVLQNLTVVPNDPANKDTDFKVVIGHRRLAAAKLAGLATLPCVSMEMTEKEQIQTMLLENMQRSDLTVYEQAQGFQMMLDMGDTVDEIAEKSGFSSTTVRRRVKLLELDGEKFKKSEARGASLFDYMELDKIKSIERKNEVLEFIGTDNFKSKLLQAISKEEQEERTAQWVEALSAFATRVDSHNGYRQVRYYYAGNKPNVEVPEDADSVDYFFTVDSYNGIRLLKQMGDEPEDKVDIERERQNAERKRRGELLNEATKRAYTMRYEFVMGVSATTVKKHLADIVASYLWNAASFYAEELCEEDVLEMLELSPADASEGDGDDDSGIGMSYSEFLGKVSEAPEKALWRALYRGIGDDGGEGYYDRYRLVHESNARLDTVYSLLEALGYGMSDEEKALRDGTHELFQEQVQG